MQPRINSKTYFSFQMHPLSQYYMKNNNNDNPLIVSMFCLNFTKLHRKFLDFFFLKMHIFEKKKEL